MRMAVNNKSTLPVTLAADFLGLSIVGLWKRFVRETGSTYSYATFHAVVSGRHRLEGMESWIRKQGFKKELKEAQATYNKKSAANKQ